jgi:hypothetical protein
VKHSVIITAFHTLTSYLDLNATKVISGDIDRRRQTRYIYHRTFMVWQCLLVLEKQLINIAFRTLYAAQDDMNRV